MGRITKMSNGVNAKRIILIIGSIFIGLLVIGLVLVSLNASRSKSQGGYSTLSSAPGPQLSSQKTEEVYTGETDQGGTTENEASSRLVIKSGNLNMVVKDVAESVKNITQYAEDKEGWIVASSVSKQKEVPSGNVTVRIPAEIFDEALAYFRGLAEKVTYEGTQGRDVTEEYVDLKAQLKNLEAAENQLLKIMERSGTITEVLAVQKELVNIRREIERNKGKIQYLETSAKMASITVNLALSEELLPIPPAEKWRPVYVLKRAWRSLLISLRSLSYLLIWIVIYGVIWAPLWIIIRQIRKFRGRKKIKKKI